MGTRKSKTATDGTKTICPNCKKAVRGVKGLKMHLKDCDASEQAGGA